MHCFRLPLFLLAALLFSCLGFAQPSLVWTSDIAIPEEDDFILPVNMLTTGDGVTTLVSQRNDFSGISPLANGIHITQVDAAGSTVWTTNILEEYGAQPQTFSHWVVFDNAGNSLIYFHTADFAGHVIKVTATGTIAWHQNLADLIGPEADGPGLDVDAEGNVFVVSYVPLHDGTFTLYFFRFSPEGVIEINESYFYGFVARLDQTHFTVTEDGVIVGMIRVVGLETYIVAQKYDLDGEFLWQYEHPTPYVFALVEDTRSLANGDILVSYQEELQSYDREFHAVKLNSAGGLIWDSHLTEESPQVFNYLFGYVPHTIPLSPDNSIAMTSTYVVPGSETYPYNGFHTYNVNAVTGNVAWEATYQLEGDSVHVGGAASSVVTSPDNHTYVIGMAMTDPGDWTNYYQDFMLLDYDFGGNLISTTSYREAGWHRMDGWIATLDQAENLYVACRAEEPSPDGGWEFELRILKYSLNAVPPPDLTFEATALDFGSVAVGESQTIQLEIQNAGPGTGIIAWVDFVQANPAEFLLAPLPLVIDSGETGTLNVTWQPIEVGELNGTLLVTHNDPDLTNPFPITLTGSATGTAADLPAAGLPQKFALSQNYPNPFNPATAIMYDLPENRHVLLTVTNSLGQTVATLVNDVQPAGRHTVTLDAGALPSGIYIYRLDAGEFSAQRKAVLIK